MSAEDGLAAASLEGHALVDHIATTLQSMMLRGQLAAGMRLRQESLAAEFGVSRTPVREALRKLQAGGLIELEPRRGAIVRGPTAREIREAYVVRAELEGLAAALAARRARESDLAGLHESIVLFRTSVGEFVERQRQGDREARTDADTENWIRANNMFHQGIHDAAGNELLKATLSDLHTKFPRDLTSTVLGESAWLIEENVAQHEVILRAIEAHDPAEARDRMIEHIHRAGELVLLRFEQQSA